MENQPKKKGGRRPGAGRPKLTQEQRDLKEICKAHTADAVATLVEIMLHADSARDRRAAAESLLDRGHGKPSQAVEHKHSGQLDLMHILDEIAARGIELD